MQTVLLSGMSLFPDPSFLVECGLQRGFLFFFFFPVCYQIGEEVLKHV